MAFVPLECRESSKSPLITNSERVVCRQLANKTTIQKHTAISLSNIPLSSITFPFDCTIIICSKNFVYIPPTDNIDLWLLFNHYYPIAQHPFNWICCITTHCKMIVSHNMVLLWCIWTKRKLRRKKKKKNQDSLLMPLSNFIA